MNEKIQNSITGVKEFWSKRTKIQRAVGIGTVSVVIVTLILLVMFSTKKNFVPLYSNLSPQETGQIKANLDQRKIPSEITSNGTSILVPEQSVDALKVELAAEGIPQSGKIDYSYFGQSSGFGMTDNEFNMVKIEATQTEIANLIKGIDGIEDANVMITLPTESIWVDAGGEQASASIVLKTKPGYQFKSEQINSLYHLVSKSVPNLPTENIVITNQNFEYFDMNKEDKEDTAASLVSNQLQVKKEIERDLQRQVQRLLGTMMGQDKVVVSVTADIDFTQENREENLVTPVDPEKMAGIAVSVERITESYTGGAKNPEGTPQAETDGDVLTGEYLTQDSSNNGDYEKVEERINNEVNKIHKQITEAPYKIRDLGIQVMVEPPNPKDPSSMTEKNVEDIRNILGTVVRTSIAKDNTGNELTSEQLSDKIYVMVQPFGSKSPLGVAGFSLPTWAVVLISIILLGILAALIFYYMKVRKNTGYSVEEIESGTVHSMLEEVHLEEPKSNTSKLYLDKLAKEKPDEFARLLRTWMSEE